VQTEQINWTGQAIGNFVIDEMICDGPFSWIYKASHRSRKDEHLALKISKPDDALEGWVAETIFPTQALAARIGGVSRIRPDAAQLLLFQSEKLKTPSDKLVEVKDVICEEDRCIVQMEWLEGSTLRKVMNARSLSVSLVLELVQSLDSLNSADHSFHHGGIKPDNIMVTDGGIKLLDPGHFGPLDTQEGVIDNCMVTTPSYYPLLMPDDLYAVGIICWEAACQAHPMDGLINSQLMDLSKTGEELCAFVRSRELAGEYFFTPILQAVRPSVVRPGMPAELEEFLLAALRLKVSGRTIDLAPGFASFTEMIAALHALQEAGIHEF